MSALLVYQLMNKKALSSKGQTEKLLGGESRRA